jgi:hypothetical protein
MKKVLFFILLIFGFLFIISPKTEAIFSNPDSIRVYVEDHPSDFIASEAMNAWTSATGGKIKFKKAAKPEDVQIYVRFVKNIGKSTNSNTIGLTHHLYANGRTLEIIEISEKAPDGRLYSRDARLRVMIHEFGHALGLEHSTNPRSVMYPSKGAKTILPDDVRTLKYIYGWK